MVFDDSVENDTPMGLLRGIKYGTESYHVLFKRLCRNTWNAVYLSGSWRFVQCNWGARHLVQYAEIRFRKSCSDLNNIDYYCLWCDVILTLLSHRSLRVSQNFVPKDNDFLKWRAYQPILYSFYDDPDYNLT
uniref:RNA-directed DNA polymerase, eukaryota, reverse transcriptase zinc-binding domain protein n=1 Tax=Heterorhabditis bacteriophora TaxID=37862 RepID=A0A1I7WRG3_HETBA